jgi:hypothetical protein
MTLTSEVVECADYWAWDRLVHERGWSDGLPVAPPTEPRISEIIDYLGRDPQELVGVVPPANGEATIEQITIQCAMAGCAPEHVPVVIAAIEAMLEPRFNLHGVQTTSNPCAPLTIVNGPIVRQLGFNVGAGAFGGGGFANAAIGRAVRLILWNIGGGKPQLNDVSPLGQPAKYAFCVAENMDASPWTPLHTDFGFDAEQNTVTVIACQSPYPTMAQGTPRRILGTLSDSLASTTITMYLAGGEILVVLSAKPARHLAAGGYSKADVRRYLFENARIPVRHLKEIGAYDGPPTETSQLYWGSQPDQLRPNVLELDDDVRLPMVVREEDIYVIVTGGDAQWWAGLCPGWGNWGGFATTREITLPR